MKIKVISHPSGDQLPLLLDIDGLPVALANEFILSRRHLSVNTLVRNLRELMVFYKWIERERFDFWARVKTIRHFMEAEIGSLLDALRRDQERRTKIRQLSVSPLTFNQRLTTIRQFINWCFYSEMPLSNERYEQVREHRNYIDSLLATAFINSPPKNKKELKRLSKDELSFLIQVLHPENAQVYGRNQAVRQRNYIAVMIMAFYGLRPGELLSLRVEDVEIGAISCLRVERRYPDSKDQRKRRPQIKRNGRVLSIDDNEFARHLDEYIMVWREELQKNTPTEFDYLILSDEGVPLSQSSLTQFFQLLRERYPENLPKHLTAKALRHTFSSDVEKLLREAGIEEDRRRQMLAYLRGDSSLSSQDVYIAQEIEEHSKRILSNYHQNLFKKEVSL